MFKCHVCSVENDDDNIQCVGCSFDFSQRQLSLLFSPALRRNDCERFTLINEVSKILDRGISPNFEFNYHSSYSLTEDIETQKWTGEQEQPCSSSPLAEALEHPKRDELINLLLEHGADPLFKTSLGSPLSQAIEKYEDWGERYIQKIILRYLEIIGKPFNDYIGQIDPKWPQLQNDMLITLQKFVALATLNAHERHNIADFINNSWS